MGRLQPIARRFWVSENLHAIVWLLFTVVAIWFYVSIHQRYEGDYLKSIEHELTYAVKQYAVRQNPRSGALELVNGGSVVDVGAGEIESVGQFDIGKLPAVRGLLHDTAVALDRYNAELASYIDKLLDAFERSLEHERYVVARLGDIAPETAERLVKNRVEHEEEVRHTVRLHTGRINSLRGLPASEVTAARLVDLLGGVMVEETVLAHATDSNTPIDQALDVRSLAEGRNVGNEVCHHMTRLGDDLRRLFVGKPERPSSDERTVGPARDSCEFTSVYEAAADATSTVGRTEAACGAEGCFHKKLRESAKDGAGFFWLFGAYKWLEVAGLAMLGVLIRRLIDFSMVYGRRQRRVDGDENVTWEPRESMRTLLYLVFTPVLAVAVIWILSLTNLLASDTVTLGQWTSYTLIPMAFLLGLFPDVGHLLLTRIVKGLFQDASETAPPPRREGRPDVPGRPQRDEPTLSPPPSDGSGPPSFEQLRSTVRGTVTSLVR